MGKAKPTATASNSKKSPIKISTSLFKKRGRRSSTATNTTPEDSSSDSSSSSSTSNSSSSSSSSTSSSPSPPPPKKNTRKSNNSNSTNNAKTPVSKTLKAKKEKGPINKPNKTPTTTKKGLTKKSEKEKPKVGIGKGKVKAVVKATAPKNDKKLEKKKGGGTGATIGRPKKLTTLTTTNKSKTTKPTNKKLAKESTPNRRGKNVPDADDTSDSSSSSSESEESSRSPSPAPSKSKKVVKKSSTEKTKTPAKIKKSTTISAKMSSAAKIKKVPKKVLVEKRSQIAKNKLLKKATKTTVAPKGKPTKPKAKLKRMASLNAKAILEASFEESNKSNKKSPAGTPTKDKLTIKEAIIHNSMTNSTPDDEPALSTDLKPLTLLFDTPFPKEILPNSSPSKPSERKRKASHTPPVSSASSSTQSPSSAPSINRRESSSSSSIGAGIGGINAQTSGGVSKKSKSKNHQLLVASSSVSTSTSPFEPSMLNDDITITSHHPHQQHQLPNYLGPDLHIYGSTGVDRKPNYQTPFSLQQPNSADHHHSIPSQHHSRGAFSPSRQRKNSGSLKTKSLAPVAQYGKAPTVYQPAGPLIEPHKVSSETGTVPVGVLPDSVRIPSDLKVTYQTRPPTSAVLTDSSSSTNSNHKTSSKHKSTGTGTTKSNTKGILHQPYKSSSSAGTSVVSNNHHSTKSQTSSSTQSILAQGTQGASFSSGPAGQLLMSSSSSLSSPLPSHLHSSSSIMGSAPGTSGMFLGYGGGGQIQSPFAPSKFPMVPPDSFRSPSPYPNPYLYSPSSGPGSPPSNYFLSPTSYYNPASPLSPSLGGVRQPMYSAPTSLTAPYYQSNPLIPPPASAHPVSNYFVAAPSPLAPAVPQHSIQPAITTPGHAGLSPRNLSSQPACPMESSRQQQLSNNSISSNNSNKFTTNSNNKSIIKTNRSLLLRQLPRQQQPVTNGMGRVGSNMKTQNPNRKLSQPILSPPSTKTKTVVQNPTPTANITKSFTEQYSLPDDITITPIIMKPHQQPILKQNINPSPKPRPKKDLVTLIDPRSGQSVTTISKQLTNKINNLPHLHISSLQPSNNNHKKPSNKMSPSLDVIPLGPKQQQRFPQQSHGMSFGNTSTKNENKAGGIRRKGLTLDECIDGLQRKKLRILADTNVSISSGPNQTVNSLNQILNQNQQLTIIPSNNIFPMNLSTTNQLGRKNNSGGNAGAASSRRPKAKPAKRMIVEPTRRISSFSHRTNSTESDIGPKIIDCNDAEAAVSALVVPPPPNGTIKIKATAVAQMQKADTTKKPIKIKFKQVGGTRARGGSNNNSVTVPKSTRGRKPNNVNIVKLPGQRGRPRIFPYIANSRGGPGGAGNGSSTLTTSNNHVILKIPKSSTPGSGNMTLTALKKRAIVKPLSPSLMNGAITAFALTQASTKKLPIHTHPRWSNGWRFEGDSFEAKVYIKNDDNPVLRRCYRAMRHDGGDIIRARDCVLLKSGPRKTDLPFVAKVSALFENPTDGEMMFSLLWYYRPEHTDIGRSKDETDDEIFASKHRDSNSVATIEDKCYVLTFNEYCRYRKKLKQLLEGVSENVFLVPLSSDPSSTTVPVSNYASNLAESVYSGITTTAVQPQVPTLSQPTPSSSIPEPLKEIANAEESKSKVEPSTTTLAPVPLDKKTDQPTSLRLPSAGKISPEAIFFCRKVYDYRQKRMLKNPS